MQNPTYSNPAIICGSLASALVNSALGINSNRPPPLIYPIQKNQMDLLEVPEIIPLIFFTAILPLGDLQQRRQLILATKNDPVGFLNHHKDAFPALEAGIRVIEDFGNPQRFKHYFDTNLAVFVSYQFDSWRILAAEVEAQALSGSCKIEFDAEKINHPYTHRHIATVRDAMLGLKPKPADLFSKELPLDFVQSITNVNLHQQLESDTPPLAHPFFG